MNEPIIGQGRMDRELCKADKYDMLLLRHRHDLRCVVGSKSLTL